MRNFLKRAVLLSLLLFVAQTAVADGLSISFPKWEPPKAKKLEQNKYRYEPALAYCIDAYKVQGLAPLPKPEELDRLENWDCYDFRGQDLSARRELSKSMKGSDFSAANLTGVKLKGSLAGAKFRNANLADAQLYGSPEDNHVDLAGANLKSAWLSGGTGGCMRHWNLTGAVLAGATMASLRLCQLTLTGESSLAYVSDVELQDVQVGTGLKLHVDHGDKLKVTGAYGDSLELSGRSFTNIQLERLRLGTFVAKDIGKDDVYGELQITDAKVTAGITLADGWFSNTRISGVITPKFDLKKFSANVEIRNSHMVDAVVNGTNVEFSDSKLERAKIVASTVLGFARGTSCSECDLKPSPGSRSSLHVADSRLAGMTVTGSWMIDAHKADLSRSTWRNVTFEKDSSLENVELNHSVFEGTELDLILANVRMSDSRFVNTGPRGVLRLADGSREIECNRCGDLLVDGNLAYLRKLSLAESNVYLRHNALNGDWEIDGLDVSRGALESGIFRGLTCRNCKFDQAKVKGGFDGLTLVNPSAVRAQFQGFSQSDKEGISITGGTFEGAVLEGSERMQASLDRVNMNDAMFKNVALQGQVSSSSFVGAQFNMGVVDSEITNSDFSRVAFPSITKGIRNSTFVRTKLSGATFADSYSHSDRLIFEKCWFDGAYGPATVKSLIKGAAGLRVVNANWAGFDLAGVQQKDVELISVDLKGAKLQGVRFVGVKLEDVKFAGADLAKAWLDGEMSNISLAGANVAGAYIKGSISGGNLSQLVGEESLDLRASLDSVDLSGDDLHNVIVVESPVYQQLTLIGTVISCGMQQQIKEQGTVTYGSYTVRKNDGSSVSCSDAVTSAAPGDRADPQAVADRPGEK